MKNKALLMFVTVFLLCGCTYRSADQAVDIFPDYDGITVPYNIAPLNFRTGYDKSVVVVQGQSVSYEFKGRHGLVKFPLKKWHRMLDAEKGNTITVTVMPKGKGSGKSDNRQLMWTISSDPIDTWPNPATGKNPIICEAYSC